MWLHNVVLSENMMQSETKKQQFSGKAGQQQEQLQQLHGVETRQLANEHAELLARSSHVEAAAEAFAQRQALDARSVATAVEQRCERLVATTRDELAASQLALRSSFDIPQSTEARHLAEIQSIKETM